jgi:nicotinamidase/pyrazinamidase
VRPAAGLAAPLPRAALAVSATSHSSLLTSHFILVVGGNMRSPLLFWDVDTLNDFIWPDGKLYVAGSEEIVPVLGALTDLAHAHRIPILASADNHELSDPEISTSPDWKTTFPPHCMRGTRGQQKIAETTLRDPLVIDPEPRDKIRLAREIMSHQGDFLILKRSLDVFSNPNTMTLVETLDPDTIVLYGVATDFCVKWAVEGILRRLPGKRTYIVTDAIRSIYPEEGNRLLSAWHEAGAQTITSRQILREHVLDSYLPTSAV